MNVDVHRLSTLLYCKYCDLGGRKKRTSTAASPHLCLTCHKACAFPVMADQQKLASLWVWLLLMATLCPGAQHVYSKHGGSIRGRGKGDGSKVSLPQSKGLLPKPGLKWAGAAAAGPPLMEVNSKAKDITTGLCGEPLETQLPLLPQLTSSASHLWCLL
ncbi:hypothetical protein JOB18_025508 [Solea senegalensis]|uniref:Uncharacterized protein n=1 Tax=Solea senegalensis TaxID=28829 RepID=A0AAV6S8I4_SOLSE|nr:hypothetical protein JOB18_025508 [Solea senegalensis]